MTKESLVGWLALIGRFTRSNAAIINVGERFNFVRNQMVENEYEMYRCKVVSQNFLSIFLVSSILSNDSLFFQVEKIKKIYVSLSFTFVRSKYQNPLAVGTAHHRIEVELQSMRASSSRVHASGIEQNISSRNELAHNRTIHSKRGGAYLSLSPTAGHYLIVLARFVYQTMLCFLYRPVSPIRFAESFHAQYTNPLRNESAPSSNR